MTCHCQPHQSSPYMPISQKKKKKKKKISQKIDSLEGGLLVCFVMDQDLVETEKRRKREINIDPGLQWSQWQLLDSILPTENTGSLLLPFVYSATMNPTLDNCQKLDRILDATLSNEVGRKASVSQGSSLMRVAASVFTELPSLKSMRDVCIGSGVVSFHHAPVFGIICGLLGMDSGTSQRAYIFMTMRDVISAATRLNLVGPLGAAVLQHRVASVAESMVKKWMDRSVEDACQTAPLLDTIQGCHTYLFSRLFCS
ncbi:hypothetical protein V6Z12_A02G133600 [Gossypium hirsutum]